LAIDKKLQTYLSLLMQQVFGYHHELDKVALIFALDPTHTTIRLRCNKYSEEISEDRFQKLAEYVLNKESEWLIDTEIEPLKKGFARILVMYGFKVTYDGKWHVEPRFEPQRLEEQKIETKTLLKDFGFKEIQEDLDSAEDHYLKGNSAQSLIMSRKALEDLFASMAMRIGVDRSNFLDSLNSKSAKELIKEIYAYGCKGHELSIPEWEAVFGYHLIVSSIYFILLIFKNR
jgi:hypothetical protein